MARQFTLSSRERIKSRKRIEELFKSGTRYNVGSLLAIYTIGDSADPALQFAVGASSRNFKKAVDRNRIKRKLREAWRLQKINLQEYVLTNKLQLLVFINYTGKELPAYKELYEDMGRLILKLSKTKQGK